jgi:protein involved in polysaccharide export with SLBB domain
MTRPFLPRWYWPRLHCFLLGLLWAGIANAQVTTLDRPTTAVETQASRALSARDQPSAPTTDRPGETQRPNEALRPPPLPGEFERFVQSLVGPVGPETPEVRRLGAELITGGFDSHGAELSPLVPPDYLVAPGDEVLLTLWGSVDADLRLVVDRDGRISVPRVGTIQIAGVRNADLQTVVERRVAQVFKNFQLSVSLGQLRGIRVFVTGFVAKPGTYTVSALSTVVGALVRAGGPSAAGSFRQVELKRGSAPPVARFDLYDLLLKGDRSADRIVQAGDVVHVGAVGTQVALIGSVNRSAVFEIKPGETVSELLAMAGGFSPVADPNRLSVERLDDRNDVRIRELRLPADKGTLLANGDVLRAFSAVGANQPIERQNKRVMIEGEVLRPGEYVLPPASSIADALRAAGGLTSAAFLFGTEFTRESVRKTQQINYDRALRDLETDFTRAAATQRTTNSEEAAAQQARSASTSRLIANLRTVRPTGRVVMQLSPDASELPDLALQDGDRLYIPPRGSTVGVFGSVFNSGNYLFTNNKNVDEFLSLAGGPTSGADASSTFVIRANGSVISARQGGGWFANNRLSGLPAQPGDTIFVPEEMDKTTFLQYAKDWTQILAQFALGVAAIQVLGD